MMPFVLLLVALVPIVVETTRATKTYAVIDETAGLVAMVESAIEVRDFKRLVTDFKSSEADSLPPYLATTLPEFQLLDDQDLDRVIDLIFTNGPLEYVFDIDISRRLQRFLADHRTDVKQWWQNLDDGARAKLSNKVSTNYFRRVSENDIESLNLMLEQGELFAYFIIAADAFDSSDGTKYISNNLTDRELQSWFGRFVSEIVRDHRLSLSNIDEETADWINESIVFEEVKLGQDGIEEEVDTTDIARQWAPVAFVYFLWVSILINTQMLITNTIEEKSNKLVEVLLSSVSPITLMGGKIIGIAATGLTIVSTWLAMAMIFFIGLPLLAGVELPIDLSSVLADPWFLLSFLMYFLLGYLLYAALLVGLGSLCNNLKEAQNLILPVQMIQMIPILLMVPIGRDPNGTLAQVLSYIPPLTPFVMMNRAAGPPSSMEYSITTLLLVVSIVAAFWLAAKIFRIGILMTGKPPGPLEIIKLLRVPVTTHHPTQSN